MSFITKGHGGRRPRHLVTDKCKQLQGFAALIRCGRRVRRIDCMVGADNMVGEVKGSIVATINYLSHDGGAGEIVLATELVRTGLEFGHDVKVCADVDRFSAKLSRPNHWTFLSTHGLNGADRNRPVSKENPWLFGDQRFPGSGTFDDAEFEGRGRRSWIDPQIMFPIIRSRVLVVLACNGRLSTWLPLVREGDFVICATTEVNAYQCVEAFRPLLSSLDVLDIKMQRSTLTLDEVWDKWGDKKRFEIVRKP